MKDFKIEFEFTSSRADGDNYTITRTIRAKNARQAITIAGITGVSEFGMRWDNMSDYRLVKQPTA